MFFSTVAIASVAALAVASPVKRGFGGRATFYATGLGACGDWNNDSDYIVALNSAQYGSGYPGPQCGKQIEISANGKTAIATIKDECPTCNYGDLDMSPSLFNVFSTPDAGVFQMNWDWVGSEQASLHSSLKLNNMLTFIPPQARAVEAVAASSTSEEVKPTASSTSEWSAPSSTVASSSSEWSAPSSSAEYASSSSVVAPSSSVKATSASSSVAVSSSASASSTVAPAAAPTVTAVLNGTDLAALAEAVAQAGSVVIVGSNSNSTANGTTVANATVVFQ